MTDLEHEIKVFIGDQDTRPVLADIGLLIKVDDLPAAIGTGQRFQTEMPHDLGCAHQVRL
jgi:hypothetical protein